MNETNEWTQETKRASYVITYFRIERVAARCLYLGQLERKRERKREREEGRKKERRETASTRSLYYVSPSMSEV